VKNKSEISLVLVSVGSLVGQNLLEIISHNRKAFKLIGTNSVLDFSNRLSLDRFELSPMTASDEFSEFLNKLILEVQPDWIIPCRDEESLILARLAEQNSFIKARTSLFDSSLAESFFDKYKSFQLSKMIGLPFAETSLAGSVDDLVDKVGLPLIAKPIKGFASIGVKLIFSQDQLEFIKSNSENLIFQEFLGEDFWLKTDSLKFNEEGFPLYFSFEEDKYSIQLHAASTTAKSSFFIGKHRMKNGISFEISKVEDSELEAIAKKALEKLIPLGLRGPLNIQLQRDKMGRFKIFEYNGRYTGASSARYYLGFNELDLLLSERFGSFEFPDIKPFSKARKVIQTIGVN
jgi:hypothetical protein